MSLHGSLLSARDAATLPAPPVDLPASVLALLADIAQSDVVAHRLTSIPGIGALCATALVAAIGKAETLHGPATASTGSEGV